ncbi:MAG: type IV pilus secretin PilQ [Nitrospirota bacterium]
MTVVPFVVALTVWSLAGCVHQPTDPSDGFSGQEVRPLERVRMVDLGDRLRFEMESDRPFSYDVSSSVAPSSVTVELPGFSKGADLQRLEVNKPPVLQMTPTEIAAPKPALQLVFSLTTVVEPAVKVEGTRLFVEFPVGKAKVQAGEGPEAAASESLVVQQEPSGRDRKPAKTMTKVEVQRGDREATVVIHGDGEFTYDVRPLSQDRLVVDLPNVASPLRLQVLPVDHPLLKQIRVGHHSQKVRVVLDLPRKSSYTVQRGPNSLAIRLTALAGADPGPGGADRREAESAETGQAGERVRVAPAGRVPFPERLAQIEESPRLAQMAPEAKGTAESEDIGQSRYVGRRISLDFQAADITNVLRLLADVSGLNIVVGEAVKAKVTMKLINVPWDQALDMLLKMNNLGMIKEGNIIWIDTLANIAKQQDEEAKAKESRVKAEDLVTRIVYVKNVQAQELLQTLRQYLSARGQVQVAQATNALVIQDTESRIAAFAKLVEDLDIEVPQIQIEARIVQADTTYIRSLGVQWGVQNLTNLPNDRVFNFFSGNTGNFAAQTGNFLVNLPASPGFTVPAVGITLGKTTGTLLDMRLSAGESLGLTKTLAAPKITTLDKREAKIEQGESIPYQTTSLQGTQTTFVDALLTLQITPQITSRDPKDPAKQILMKVRATRNAPGSASNPNAGVNISKREAITQVLVRDGETMVIGGIMEDVQTNTVNGVPYLSRIPIIGWLFKSKTENISKKELLIFLTPIILKS